MIEFIFKVFSGLIKKIIKIKKSLNYSKIICCNFSSCDQSNTKLNTSRFLLVFFLILAEFRVYCNIQSKSIFEIAIVYWTPGYFAHNFKDLVLFTRQLGKCEFLRLECTSYCTIPLLPKIYGERDYRHVGCVQDIFIYTKLYVSKSPFDRFHSYGVRE